MQAPALEAAEAGFDVWLGNSRGNLFSRSHLHLDQRNKEDSRSYWDFSWAEIGKYDIPATIKLITEKTESPKLAYVGFSQGTIQMFYGMSTSQEFYEQHVSVFVALAPCALIANPHKAA